MARVVVISDDLLWGSNAVGVLQATGHAVSLVVPGGEVGSRPDLFVVDLASQGFDGIALLAELDRGDGEEAVPVLGVYSHVDVETKRAADAAGFTRVVPRSRMAREGGALVDGLLAG